MNLNNFKNYIEDYYFNLYDIVDISTVFKNDENDKDYKIKQNKGFSLYNYEELNQQKLQNFRKKIKNNNLIC